MKTMRRICVLFSNKLISASFREQLFFVYRHGSGENLVHNGLHFCSFKAYRDLAKRRRLIPPTDCYRLQLIVQINLKTYENCFVDLQL